MGCRLVAMVIMRDVFKYEIRIFGANPKFNMAPIQKLQKVNMPKCSYSIHIFLALDSCIHVFSLILMRVGRYKNVVAMGEVINKVTFKNANFTGQWDILSKKLLKNALFVEHDFSCVTLKMKAL